MSQSTLTENDTVILFNIKLKSKNRDDMERVLKNIKKQGKK